MDGIGFNIASTRIGPTTTHISTPHKIGPQPLTVEIKDGLVKTDFPVEIKDPRKAFVPFNDPEIKDLPYIGDPKMPIVVNPDEFIPVHKFYAMGDLSSLQKDEFKNFGLNGPNSHSITTLGGNSIKSASPRFLFQE